MENLIDILGWVGWISGGILIAMLLLSLIGGLDLDLDLDMDGGSDADTGSGGLGPIKWVLVFVSMGALVSRIVLDYYENPLVAFVAGAAAGGVAGFLLSWFLRLLLRNQEEVNWHPEEAIGKEGKVYARIKEGQTGIVKVVIRGAIREIKAISETEIPTGSEVEITGLEDNLLVVQPNKK